MNEMIDIIFGCLPILLRDGMGSKEGGDNIQGSLPANAMDYPEHFQLRFRFQAISALDLKCGCAKLLS